MKNLVRLAALALAIALVSASAAWAQGYKLTLTQRTDDSENDDQYFETTSSCVVAGRSGNNPDGSINVTAAGGGTLSGNNADLNYVRFSIGETIRAHHHHPASHPPGGGYPLEVPDEPGEPLDGCTGTKINGPGIDSVIHVLTSTKKGVTSLRIYHYAERYFFGTGGSSDNEMFNMRTDPFPCAALAGGGWECDATVNITFEYQHNHPRQSQTTVLGTRTMRVHVKLVPLAG